MTAEGSRGEVSLTGDLSFEHISKPGSILCILGLVNRPEVPKPEDPDTWFEAPGPRFGLSRPNLRPLRPGFRPPRPGPRAEAADKWLKAPKA